MEAVVERVAGHGGGIAQDDEFHAGASDGHIHAPQVAQEAYLPLLVGTHEADEHDVAFLPLKTVDGIHRNAVPERAKKFGTAQKVPQKLHLRPVGRNDGHIDVFIEHMPATHLDKVVLQRA